MGGGLGRQGQARVPCGALSPHTCSELPYALVLSSPSLLPLPLSQFMGQLYYQLLLLVNHSLTNVVLRFDLPAV